MALFVQHPEQLQRFIYSFLFHNPPDWLQWAGIKPLPYISPNGSESDITG